MEEIITVILFVLIGYLGKICKSKFKGYFGEKKVANILSFLPSNEYRVFNDVLVKNGDRTTQIDHIVVSIYGIFVIETKNYSGWITGSNNSQYWTKNMFGNKYTFYNPIRQNKNHILALCKYLQIKNDKFISIVAFSNKTNLLINTEENVIHINQINWLIRKYKDIVFSQNDVENLASKINDISFISSADRKQHISNTKHIVAIKKNLERQGICPICGHNLILRNGKYGKFIGCSNYPKCNFVDSIR